MTTTAPAPTETAPATRRTTASKPAAEPTPWQLRVQGLAANASRLADDLKAQRQRIDDLAALKSEREAIHHALEFEEIDFVAASSKLATLADKIAALEFATGKRGEAGLLAANALRCDLMNLKHDLLGGLNRAAGGAVKKRQAEVSALVAGWGNTPAPESPLPLWTVANADPTCRALERHRLALESWLPDRGPAALLALAGAAADFLAGVEVPPETELRRGGPQVPGAALITGWDGTSPGLETIAILDNAAESMELFRDLIGRSGFAGMRQIFRLPHDHPEGSGNLPPETARNLDYHANSAFSEHNPPGAFVRPEAVAGALAWLDLAPMA